jgi:RNA polymerase sigma-70 factor, ECF subfamily
VLPFARDDAALISALRARQPGAPAMLVDRFGPYVERLLARIVGLDPELPDLMQDVFVAALSSLGDLKELGALKAWLGSVTVFTARAWIRQRAMRRRWVTIVPPEKVPEPMAQTASPEVNEALARTYAILDKLPADQRIAFALRFVEGMDLSTVASLCRVSLATAKRRIDRAEASFVAAADEDVVLREHVARSPRWRRDT